MSSSQQTNLPLPQYYAKTLQSLLPIFDDSLPLSEPSTQAQLAKATDDLYLISRMLTSLGVFSDNEGLDELGDRELVFMTVPWVLGEAEAKGGLGGYPDRIAALRRSDTAFNAFLGLLQTYNVFGSDEQAEGSSSTAPGAVPSDPGQRREAKIRAYRREKELKERISVSTELRLLQTLTEPGRASGPPRAVVQPIDVCPFVAAQRDRRVLDISQRGGARPAQRLHPGLAAVAFAHDDDTGQHCYGAEYSLAGSLRAHERTDRGPEDKEARDRGRPVATGPHTGVVQAQGAHLGWRQGPASIHNLAEHDGTQRP